MPNSWLNNKKVIWLSLLVYLLTGLGPVCASFSGADILACDERSSSCRNASKDIADDKLGGYSLGTTRCAPDGNDYHLPIKSRLRIPRTLAPSYAFSWALEQVRTQSKTNVLIPPPLQILAPQPYQSLRQLRTIVLLN